MDIVSRTEWGARQPAGGRNNINSHPLGTAIHWNGPGCAASIQYHSQCAGFVRGIQNFHMNVRGWSDIAYTDFACPHGYLFEGRGRDVGTAANGTDYGNASYYATYAMWGEDDGPVPELMLDTIAGAVAEHRDWGAGSKVTTHRALYATECPGSQLAGLVDAGRFDGGRGGGAQSVPFEKPAPTPSEGGFTPLWEPTGKMSVEQVQRAVGVTADGLYGQDTKDAVAAYQAELGVTADGLWGKTTEAAHKSQRESKSKAPKFPLPRGHWYGPESSDKRNHSGYWKGDRAGIRKWQAQMAGRGWTISVDGVFGEKSESVAEAFQKEKGLAVDGCVGKSTWAASWTEPVT